MINQLKLYQLFVQKPVISFDKTHSDLKKPKSSGTLEMLFIALKKKQDWS